MTEHVDAGWSVREFEGLDLGDARLNRRLLTMAEAFGAHPQAPINQVSADWQDTRPPTRSLTIRMLSLPRSCCRISSARSSV